VFENHDILVDFSKGFTELKDDFGDLTDKFDEFDKVLRDLNTLNLNDDDSVATMDIDDDDNDKIDKFIFKLNELLVHHKFKGYIFLLKNNIFSKEMLLKYSQLLANTLCAQLQDYNLQKSYFVELLGYLKDIGYSNKARSIFFYNKKRQLKHEIHHARYIPEYDLYIEKVAELTFTNIVETGKEHKQLFSDLNNSAYVVWATGQVGKFIVSFAKHVSEICNNSDLVDSCVVLVLYKSRVLTNYGLDMYYLLKRELLKFYKR
jgi:hypothetical protein